MRLKIIAITVTSLELFWPYKKVNVANVFLSQEDRSTAALTATVSEELGDAASFSSQYYTTHEV